MKTTLDIDERILKRASLLTGVKEKASLVRLGLEALVAHASARRLARLAGFAPHLKDIPRRKSAYGPR